MKLLIATIMTASTLAQASPSARFAIWNTAHTNTAQAIHYDTAGNIDSVIVNGAASDSAKSEMESITQAQIDEYNAAQSADSTEDAALGQEMTVALVQAIAARWPDEPPFTGEAAQVRQLTRRLIIESQAARLTLGDTNATVDARLDAVFSLRELDVISGYATQLGIGKKR